MEAIYRALSGHIHAYSPVVVGDVVTITEGPLNREQMRALACLAERIHVPYKLEYIKEPEMPTPYVSVSFVKLQTHGASGCMACR